MSQQEIIALFDQWNEALKTLDADKVSALYDHNALLMPTMSEINRFNRAEINDYFISFLQSHPRAELIESSIKVDQALAVHSGVYRFSFKDMPSVRARFTFVYQKGEQGWRIAQHHSSRQPD